MTFIYKTKSALAAGVATAFMTTACVTTAPKPPESAAVPAAPAQTFGQRVDGAIDWLGRTAGEAAEAGKSAVNILAKPLTVQVTGKRSSVLRPNDTTCEINGVLKTATVNKATNVPVFDGMQTCASTIAPKDAGRVKAAVDAARRPGADLALLDGFGMNKAALTYGFEATRQDVVAQVPHDRCTYSFTAASRKSADGSLTGVCLMPAVPVVSIKAAGAKPN